jgi:hypothetical protein
MSAFVHTKFFEFASKDFDVGMNGKEKRRSNEIRRIQHMAPLKSPQNNSRRNELQSQTKTHT